MKRIDLSIVICMYNRHELLREALLQQSVQDFDYEVVVLDNNSTPETRTVIDESVTQIFSSRGFNDNLPMKWSAFETPKLRVFALSPRDWINYEEPTRISVRLKNR